MFICCFCCYYNRQLAWLGLDYNFLFVLLDCQSLCGAQICLVCVPHSGHSRTCTVISSSCLILKAFGMLVRSDSYICNSEVHIQLYGITLFKVLPSCFSLTLRKILGTPFLILLLYMKDEKKYISKRLQIWFLLFWKLQWKIIIQWPMVCFSSLHLPHLSSVLWGEFLKVK